MTNWWISGNVVDVVEYMPDDIGYVVDMVDNMLDDKLADIGARCGGGEKHAG